MDIETAFAYQLDEKRPLLTFFAYDHPKAENQCEMFQIAPSKLHLMPQVWELVTPVFISEESILPRLRYIGPR